MVLFISFYDLINVVKKLAELYLLVPNGSVLML